MPDGEGRLGMRSSRRRRRRWVGDSYLVGGDDVFLFVCNVLLALAYLRVYGRRTLGVRRTAVSSGRRFWFGGCQSPVLDEICVAGVVAAVVAVGVVNLFSFFVHLLYTLLRARYAVLVLIAEAASLRRKRGHVLQ